ncbi:MAG: nucleotidyltransferase domain-containing protein, partial [Anaerolineales bacterium]|nr:nucleotidyltransferase domain-containing protein [Anaerolineales bacterium]
MSEFLDSIPQKEITGFCQKWQIREFALFGSVVGEAFKLESDIDVLV